MGGYGAAAVAGAVQGTGFTLAGLAAAWRRKKKAPSDEGKK